jgi:hypothetical protein
MTHEPVAGTPCSALQKCKVKNVGVFFVIVANSTFLGTGKLVETPTRTAAQKNMKTPQWFTRNRLASHLRIASVVTLMFAAAAMAFVAIKPPSPTLVSSQDRLRALNKFRADRDQLPGNRRTLPGDQEGGPLLAALEDYAHRAYPAKDVPMTATLNAIASFRHVRAMSMGRPSVGAWQLIGPSKADAPDILTFSGTEYFTSGRVTALAIDPNCGRRRCTVWVGAAGGGVWRTDNGLSASGASWTFVSDSFGTNAIGTLTYDAANNTLYAGTGEANASGDSEAGIGIYKSTDRGNTWTQLASTIGPIHTFSPGTGDNGTYGPGNAFLGRSISSIAVDPTNSSHLYVSSSRGVRGVSSVTGGGTSNPPTPRPPFGLFESTDGGATFSFIWDGGDGCPATCDGTNPKATIRGVNHVALDPGWNGTTNKILYGGAFGPTGVAGSGGVWRSTDGGVTLAQIKSALDVTPNTDRAEFAVTPITGGFTRMYVGIGNDGTDLARFYRTDDAAGAAVFTDLTTDQNIDYCDGQCWYDNVVYTPPGKPDVVYLGGSFSYGSYAFTTNGRAFIRSADAGASFTDMTWDATTNPTPPGSCCQPNPVAPNGQHPDSHAIVEIPGTDSAIFGGDGGLMRSSGAFADISSQCTTYRGLSGSDLALCQQLLSAVPTYLYNLNKGLSTLQFQSLSVAADNAKHLQGGTQDNGTFETYGSSVIWPQIIYGDGGQSGFDVGNSAHRFNTFFSRFTDANFQNGDPSKWVVISAPLFGDTSLFYKPIIADPVVSGTIFVGLRGVWRTQDWGGDQATLEANCPEFTTPGNQPGCGDFVVIGGANTPSGPARLTGTFYGADRSGGNVAAVERAPSDTGTLWAATTTGRVFISTNADAAAGSVTYTRLDTLPSATADPGRFVSGIYVDPANPNHAWISYSGYNFNTPSQPGHVFEVTYNGTSDATWTSLDNPGGTAYPDFPATDIVRDSNGDLYVSNDFGVMVLANGSTSWATAGTGLPMVEVAGLTIVPGSRVLYAATHGRSAWKLTLP